MCIRDSYKALQGYLRGGRLYYPALLPPGYGANSAPDSAPDISYIRGTKSQESGAITALSLWHFGSLWDHYLGSFFGYFWGHFLDHFLEYVNNRFNRLKNVCIRSYKASWGLIRPYKVTLWTHLGLSWAVFGAILRNLIQSWTILGSFWDRFWAILNNFETILSSSSK